MRTETNRASFGASSYRGINCFSIMAALIFHCLLTSCVNYTNISTQSQFDEVVARVNDGEEMHLVVKPGKYVLTTSVKAKVPFSIKGKNVTITSVAESYNSSQATRETQTHYVYKLSNELTLFPLFYDNNDSLLAVSESVIDSVRVNFVNEDIVATTGFKKGSAIKILIPENLNHLKGKPFSGSYGYLDSGWDVVNLQVERSDDAFFYCKTLNNCTTKDFQYDKSAYRKPIRFVLYNAELKTDAIFYDKEYLYVPKWMGEVHVVNLSDEVHKVPGITTYSDVDIEGVSFCGGTKINIHSGLNERCRIKNCSFHNTLGYALNIVKTNGEDAKVAIVEDCDFQNCSIYSGSVVLLNSNKNNGKTCIEMRGCTVGRYPSNRIIYKNSKGGIWADGDILLERNVVYNTCRNHLHLCKGKIIVRGNDLYNTDEFTAQKDRNLSSDWGLIYCDHKYNDIREALDNKSNQIVIEGNLLYGAYAYGGDARGVFIDHGRGDVICNDNVILNSQKYSIDSRYVKSNEASSVRNRYERNVVTTNYRLMASEGVEGQNKPVTNGNLLLTEKNNKILNIFTEEKDQQLMIDKNCSLKEGKVYVSEALYRQIKKSRAWKYNKKFIKELNLLERK